MHIDELCRRFGVTRRYIHELTYQKLIPPPVGGRKNATYTHEHVEAIQAYQTLKHSNTILQDLPQILREDGITLAEYVRQREAAIRYHGLGVA